MAADEEARLKSVIETAVDGIITIDERGQVESFNPAAERMFGYAASEVLGRNVSLLMASPDRQQHDDYLKRYQSTNDKRIIGDGREVVGRRKDGSTFPLRLSVGEFQLGGARRFTGIAHDLTEQKRAEKRALQAERLAAIGETMAVLTHESRNSLQLSQANLEMLCHEIQDLPQAAEYAARIQMAQDRLQRLFEELQDFAAPVCLDCQPYNLGQMLAQVFNELSAVHTSTLR